MIHPTVDVGDNVEIGNDTRVWHRTQICTGARVGDHCIIGSAVYIDRGVTIGNKVKIQTGAQLYHGSAVEDGVFIGPMVCLSNDRYPRAITPDGRLKGDADWVLGRVRIRYGASLGTGAIVLPGVDVGSFAMIGAGAVVTKDVPDFGLVVGSPARLVAYVCACGRQLEDSGDEVGGWVCPECAAAYLLQPTNGGMRPLTLPSRVGRVDILTADDAEDSPGERRLRQEVSPCRAEEYGIGLQSRRIEDGPASIHPA